MRLSLEFFVALNVQHVVASVWQAQGPWVGQGHPINGSPAMVDMRVMQKRPDLRL